ncbi:hypothetical protein BH11ACT8_BH11ACT8_15530 [soil metagenome]
MGGPGADVCSAKGCTRTADWQLLWNNPKLHTPDRRKVWLACDEHRETLGAFLGARSFLKDVVAHEPGADQPPSQPPG